MIKLTENETILLVIRRHWIVFVAPAFIFLVFLLLPFVAAIAFSAVPILGSASLKPLASFGLAVYLLLMFAGLTTWWLKYYLDVWIITDRRLIDIDQRGLFRREVSEVPLERVQNVTTEVPGFLGTLFGYGRITIQTASQNEFSTTEVPHCGRAKDIIVKHSQTRARLVGSGVVPPANP